MESDQIPVEENLKENLDISNQGEFPEAIATSVVLDQVVEVIQENISQSEISPEQVSNSSPSHEHESIAELKITETVETIETVETSKTSEISEKSETIKNQRNLNNQKNQKNQRKQKNDKNH